MKRQGPLLGRLVLWQFVTLALTLVGFTSILVVVLSQQLREHHDAEIVHLCRRAQDALVRRPRAALDDPELLRDLQRIDHSVHLVALPAVPPGTQTGRIELSTRTLLGDMLRVAAVVLGRPDGGVVQLEVTEPLGDVDTTISRLKLLSFSTVPLVLVVAALVTIMVLHQALRPLRKVVRSTAAIGAANLHTRVQLANAPREIAQLVDTLNQMMERLDGSFAQTQRFTANASHELRTPLSALTASLEVALSRERTPDEYRAILQRALLEVGRLGRMVHNLLLMAQADSGELTLVRQPVALDELLQDSVDVALPKAEGAAIDLLLGDDHGLAVSGDRAWLRQLIDNLLDNAIKYTPAGGEVRVEVAAEGDRARITVRDTGPGVPLEEREYIFERFHRTEAARSLDVDGAGLGLAIARWVAEAQGGSLVVTDSEPRGAAFVLRLPLA